MSRLSLDFNKFYSELNKYLHEGYSFQLSMRKMGITAYYQRPDFTVDQYNKIENMKSFYKEKKRTTPLDKKLPNYFEVTI